MKANIAAVGLGHPFEVGFDQAESLLNTTVDTLTAQGINCKIIFGRGAVYCESGIVFRYAGI